MGHMADWLQPSPANGETQSPWQLPAAVREIRWGPTVRWSGTGSRKMPVLRGPNWGGGGLGWRGAHRGHPPWRGGSAEGCSSRVVRTSGLEARQRSQRAMRCWCSALGCGNGPVRGRMRQVNGGAPLAAGNRLVVGSSDHQLSENLSYPVLRKREWSLHTCAQDV
jgi:hypothetical protein